MTPLEQAWQAALAAEHEAVFGYAVLGPHLDATEQQLARACAAAHQASRDGVEAAMAAAGLTPTPARAQYPSLYPVSGAAAARRLAVRLEERCAAAWRYLYLQAASAAPARSTVAGTVLRAPAQDGLTSSALRATRWRVLVTPAHPTTAFPGL